MSDIVESHTEPTGKAKRRSVQRLLLRNCGLPDEPADNPQWYVIGKSPSIDVLHKLAVEDGEYMIVTTREHFQVTTETQTVSERRALK